MKNIEITQLLQRVRSIFELIHISICGYCKGVLLVVVAAIGKEVVISSFDLLQLSFLTCFQYPKAQDKADCL